MSDNPTHRSSTTPRGAKQHQQQARFGTPQGSRYTSSVSTSHQTTGQTTDSNNAEVLEEEYLFLSHGFVHHKLPGYSAPCNIKVAIESLGVMLPGTHKGQLLQSRAKDFYKLTAPPKHLLLGKEIFGIRLKQDGTIIIQLKERRPALKEDGGRRRVRAMHDRTSRMQRVWGSMGSWGGAV